MLNLLCYALIRETLLKLMRRKNLFQTEENFQCFIRANANVCVKLISIKFQTNVDNHQTVVTHQDHIFYTVYKSHFYPFQLHNTRLVACDSRLGRRRRWPPK